MARTALPDSASAQFFINVVDNNGKNGAIADLNHKAKTPQGWGYCVFGKVVAGMDVVDKIRDTRTGTVPAPVYIHLDDVPAETVEIKSIKVKEEKK
jgi:peptidyl-prolyl cis-trans isomerase B (cyclophilin B)